MSSKLGRIYHNNEDSPVDNGCVSKIKPADDQDLTVVSIVFVLTNPFLGIFAEHSRAAVQTCGFDHDDSSFRTQKIMQLTSFERGGWWLTAYERIRRQR